MSQQQNTMHSVRTDTIVSHFDKDSYSADFFPQLWYGFNNLIHLILPAINMNFNCHWETQQQK